MSQLGRLEGAAELNCSAEKMFEMHVAKQPDIAKLCSSKVSGIQAHRDDWMSVGSTRRWDYVIDGKAEYLIDRIEEIDENNMMLHRSVIEGDLMNYYKTLTIIPQVIPKGDDSCVFKLSFVYEKMNKDAPEPQKFHDFAMALFKELGAHLSNSS